MTGRLSFSPLVVSAELAPAMITRFPVSQTAHCAILILR